MTDNLQVGDKCYFVYAKGYTVNGMEVPVPVLGVGTIKVILVLTQEYIVCDGKDSFQVGYKDAFVTKDEARKSVLSEIAGALEYLESELKYYTLAVATMLEEMHNVS